MIRLFSLFPLALLGACAAESRAPAPDPAKVEQLLTVLESQAEAAPPAPAARAEVPDAAQEKLGKADRLVGSLEKMPSERLDPSVAEALLTR